MNLRSQRRMAAEVMDVGLERVWLDPEALDEIATAITRDDIRFYIDNDLIQKKEKKGSSKGRLRFKKAQKKKGRRRGHGHRSGGKSAREPSKKKWINKIRALRDELRKLKDEGEITPAEYRKLYRQAKGNMFHSRRHMREHIERMKG